LFLLSCGSATSVQPPPSATGYTLVWSDEFSGTDGSSPDATKWTYDTGGSGWGNSELECYTNLTQNVQVNGGNLVITSMSQSCFLANRPGASSLLEPVVARSFWA